MARMVKPNTDLTRIALGIGIAVPVLYFGTQLVAARFYPGYNFLTQAASELGSDAALYPWIFNIGAVATGIAGLMAAVGVFRALRSLDTHPFLAGLITLTLVAGAVGSLWAGVFPLPDPRHSANPFSFGLLLLPPLLLVAVWRRIDARFLKLYLAADIVLCLILIAILSGAVPLATGGYQGLVQRIAAIVFYVPIGIASGFLLLKPSISAEGDGLSMR
jgi:hypothetical membrane protein